MKAAITLLALLVASSGYFVSESFGAIPENQAFLLEGSGFAVSEETIKLSQITLGLFSQDKRGSSTNFLIEDGFVTLDGKKFTISDLEGKFLREGNYIRLTGEIKSSGGSDTSISFFGRLVDESKDASVYGFTGRITTPDTVYKVIYTTKLSTIEKAISETGSASSDKFTVHILENASTQGIRSDIVPGQKSSVLLRFFSDDRISIEPKSTITIVNDDTVSHKLISGKENYGDRHDPFTPDGRISTGVIEPGETATITFDEKGFYRLYDPDYTWMKIVAYVFPNSDSLTLGTGLNAGN